MPHKITKLLGAFLFLYFSYITSLYSQEQLVKSRILLVYFTNLQNQADFAYLEVSIPDAMLIALDETKNFDLLEVSTWENLVQSGKFSKTDTKNDKKMQAAGMSLGADVVVLGNFANIGQDLKITARAIETKSGRLIISKSVLAKTDGSMFGSIDNLALQMAKEMKDKLPPLPPREVIREKFVTRDVKDEPIISKALLSASIGKAYPGNNIHKDGFNQAAIDFYSPWPALPWDTLLYANFTYRLLPTATLTTSMLNDTTYDASILSLGLGLAYRYRFSNRWFLLASAGARFSQYQESNTIAAVANKAESRSIGAYTSLALEYVLFQSAGFFAGAFYSYEPIGSASPVNIGGYGAMAGVTYRN